MTRWLSVVLLLLGGAACAQVPGYPHVACYANTHGGGNPIISNALDPWEARAVSKFQLISLNTTPWFDQRPGMVDTIRAMHTGPERLRIFAYDSYGQKDAFATAGTNWKAAWDIVNDGGTGLLYDTGGNFFAYAAHPWPNLSRAEIVRGLDSVLIANVVKPGRVDGFLFDNLTGTIDDSNSDNTLKNDFARAGYASTAVRDTLRLRNIVASASRIRGGGQATLGRQLAVMANGSLRDTLAARATWQGILFESVYPLTTSISPLDNLIHQYQNAGPYGWISNYVTSDAPLGNDGTEYDATHCKQERFGLAVASMGNGYASFGPNRDLPASTTAESYLTWWYDEYSVNVDPTHVTAKTDTSGGNTGWAGRALAPAFRTPEGLWARNFRNGCSLLNKTGATQTVDLVQTFGAGRFWRIGGIRDATTNTGNEVSAVTLLDGDAVFLVKLYPQRDR